MIAADHVGKGPFRQSRGEGYVVSMVGRALPVGGARAVGVPVAGGSHRGNFIASLYGDAGSLAGSENVPDWFDGLRR